MNRRDVFMLGTSGAAAVVGSNLIACAEKQAAKSAGEKAPDPHAGHAGHAMHSGGNAFANAAQECVTAGNACLNHCLVLLASGDTSMGDCAKTVRAMLAVCQAAGALATSGTKHLKEYAALCKKLCADCAEACRPHASKHAECRACLAACEATQKEAAKI